MLQFILGLISSSCQTLHVLICRVPIILERNCCTCRVCLNAPRAVQTSAKAACRLQSAKQEIRWMPDAVKADFQPYSDHQHTV